MTVSTSTTSESIRSQLVETLELDLIGPGNGHAFARELLPESPTHWYLAGFLVPIKAPLEQRTDEAAGEEIDSAEKPGVDDDAPPEKPAARKGVLPSSMGLSVLVAPGTPSLQATVEWGDYAYEGGDEPAESAAVDGKAEPAFDAIEAQPSQTVNADSSATPAPAKPKRGWRRIPRTETIVIPLPNSASRTPRTIVIPNSARGNGEGELMLAVTTRPMLSSTIGAGQLPKGTRSISVFVVNYRVADKEHRYRAFAFQVKLRLESPAPFVARPDLRGGDSASGLMDAWDERVADVQYRDTFEYAVGHGVSAVAVNGTDGACARVESVWLPSAEVEIVAPSELPEVELGMEALSALTDGAQAADKLTPLVTRYRAWIDGQAARSASLSTKQRDTANDMLSQMRLAANRIEAGIRLLGNPQVLQAFRIANKAMARAAIRREWVKQDRAVPLDQIPAPAWRPFQLAYILMTLHGIAASDNDEAALAEREAVDLLFFPTGGGKTEAYLGLAAFTLVLRRLRHPGRRSGGLSVLMRYTLRLLTLDQLGRAATLICALELERESNLEVLGEWPFEIGLWVGQGATPNRMGKRNDKGSGSEYTAYTKTMHFKQDDQKKPAPIPLENCPWCGQKFTRGSFHLSPPNAAVPLDLHVVCTDLHCDFSGDRHLPIVAVDEPIYRRLPAFMIATVDKFAALPWTGETGALFGLVDRFDENGYYGPMQPNVGQDLGGQLPPPDLIIQDELHLISGPLGTIAGVYEAAIDKLSSREVNGRALRPKIIASTATVRRAQSQIQALFDRSAVNVFPPPGPDRRDSFFAHTEPSSQLPARLYLGVAAQGRSLKVVFLRALLALLSAGQVAFEAEGGKKNKRNPADPYMTVLAYFNSLRELGGSRRIVEDEVVSRLTQYGRRKRLEPNDGLFANRKIGYEPLELTSRVATNEVAVAKRRLGLGFDDKEYVDVALATNMISVGLDITRLGLMVVLGQPKTSAEYIQATSRVGRLADRPGLILTLLNVHKPRDRSHYERFASYHASFYRAVEATSVTPFSPRALDRALPAALVALARLSRADMTPAKGAGRILDVRAELDVLANFLAERARTHAWPRTAAAGNALYDSVRNRCVRLLDDWLNIAQEFQNTNTALQYQQEVGGAQRLLYTFLDSEVPNLTPVQRKFRANRSMRDVEPSVDVYIKDLLDWGTRP